MVNCSVKQDAIIEWRCVVSDRVIDHCTYIIRTHKWYTSTPLSALRKGIQTVYQDHMVVSESDNLCY